MEERLRNIIKSYFKASENNMEIGMSQEDIDEAQIIDSYFKNKRNGILSFNIPASRINHINYSEILEQFKYFRI